MTASSWGATTFGDPCRECGFAWTAAPADCHAVVAAAPRDMAALVAGADPSRRRPSGGWSIAGYVGHVGDSIRVWAERVAAAALGDDRPAPYDQDLLAAARGYDATSLTAVLWNLDRSVEDWRAAFSLAAVLASPDGARPLLLRHPELGHLDLDDVVRIRAHDVAHHRWDVAAILAL